MPADLTEFGETIDPPEGADAVVHLAAIPAPWLQTDEVTFRTNVSSTHNVIAAATTLRLKRVVPASSETVLGLPFKRLLPRAFLAPSLPVGPAGQPRSMPPRRS